MTPFVFQFPATIDAWHDADTCYVHRQTKPGETLHGEHVRVEGINAPELSVKAGKVALDYASVLAPEGTKVLLVCSRSDKYGRLLARIILPDGNSFGDEMIAAGKAVPYLV